MTIFSRRNFITLSSLSIMGLKLLPLSSIVLTRKRNLNDIPTLLREAAVYRKNGLYKEALNLYEEIIAIRSDEIRAYDGIRKIYLQSKYKELDVLQLYIDGLANNPGNSVFKERIAKEYMRLALGNKRMSQNIGNNLLEEAKTFFDEIVISNPENIQFVVQREKVYRKISQEADIVDARENQDIKTDRKNNRIAYKARFNNTEIRDLEEKLTDMLEAPLSVDRNKHIREMYVTLLKKYHINGDKVNLTNKIVEFYNYNDDDGNSLYLIRRFCRRNELPIIENIEKLNNTKKNTFWSNIALAGTLIKLNKTTEAGTYLSAAKTKSVYYSHGFEIKAKEVRNAIKRNDFANAKSLIINFGDYILGISSSHHIDRFNILCVRYYLAKGQSSEALKVLNIGLNIDNRVYDDPILKKVMQINRFRDDEKLVHKERLNDIKQSMG